MAGQLKEELVLKTGQFSQGINSAISEVQKLKKKGKELGSGFDSSLGGIISKLKGFNVAALAGVAAGKALGEYLKRNAEINNTLMSSYKMLNSGMETFWNTMARGDWDNFANNLKKSTSAAKEAYYALNQLETTKTFNEVRLNRLEVAYNNFRNLAKDRNLTEKQRLVYLDKAKKAMNQQLTIMRYQLRVQMKLAKLKYTQALSEVGIDTKKISQKAFEKVTGMSPEQIDRFKKNFEKSEAQAKKSGKFTETGTYNGEAYSEFNREKWLNSNSHLRAQSIIYDVLDKMENLNGNDAFRDYIEAEKEALSLENEINSAQAELSSDAYDLNKDLTNEHKKQEEILKRITQEYKNVINKANKFSEELQNQQKNTNPTNDSRLGNISVYDKMNAQRFQDLVKQGKGKFSFDNNGGTKTYNEEGYEVYFKLNEDSVEDIYTKYNKLVNRAQEAMKDNELGILSAEEVNATIDYINKELEKLGLKPVKLHVETDAEKALRETTSAIDALGSSFQGLGQALEMPALDVAGVMAQAIATMIQAYATAQDIAAKTTGPWGWLAFGAIGLAQLVSIISTVKSLGAYANGGIVGGSSYAGDRLYARVNSGEMILNGNQQQHLFNMINNGGGGVASTGEVQFVIRGADLYGAMKNYNSKMKKVR